MASQDITADVAEVGERLSCAYRRTPQVILKASPAESPASVACIRLPRLGEVVQLACTGCQHVYELDLADLATGNTGGGWIWIAKLGIVGAEIGGDGP